MATRFPRLELTTTKNCNSWLCVLAIAWLASSVLAAEHYVVSVLEPYSARYTTTLRGMTTTLTRTLAFDVANNRYSLISTGSTLVAGYTERSVFHIQGSEVIPHSYRYQGTGLASRLRELHFSPDGNGIRSLYKNEWYDLPGASDIQDRLSQQAQLRLFLLNDPQSSEPLVLPVADGKRVKNHRLLVVAEEMLETAVGRINTLHLTRLHEDPKRKTDIWLAPEWGYLMVKMRLINGAKPVEVMLTDVSIGGIPVSGTAWDQALGNVTPR